MSSRMAPRKVQDCVAAALWTAVCRIATANPPAYRGGHLSELVGGVEGAPEALGPSILLTRTQSAEGALRATEERQLE